MRKTQDPAQRFWSKVDKTSTCWNWTAAKQTQGYGVIMVNSRHQRAHRLSFEWSKGPIPDGMWIDHICMNRACVRPDHLRLATPKQNTEHRPVSKNNLSSGVRGVSLGPRGKWQGRVTHYGKTMSAGLFDTVAEAEVAVIALRNELFTHNELDKLTQQQSEAA